MFVRVLPVWNVTKRLENTKKRGDPYVYTYSKKQMSGVHFEIPFYKAV
jgi:hypothetical protein